MQASGCGEERTPAPEAGLRRGGASLGAVFTVIRGGCSPGRAEPGRPASPAPYRRCDKSLSTLSARFLANLWHRENFLLNLEELTRQLDIERRRLYDIINILEGLGLIYRVSKSSFMWRGLEVIRQNIRKIERHLLFEESLEALESLVMGEFAATATQAKVAKRDKSLALLSLRMVREFYVRGAQQSLEQLAASLDDRREPSRHKTMVRRLYDIANVYKAIGLVRKSLGRDRSVVIEWLGMDGVDSNLRRRAAPQPGPGAHPPGLRSAFRVSVAGAWADSSALCGKREPQPELSEALLASIGELLGPTKQLRQASDAGPEARGRGLCVGPVPRYRDENQHPNLPAGAGPVQGAWGRPRVLGQGLRPLRELGLGGESGSGSPLLGNFNY